MFESGKWLKKGQRTLSFFTSRDSIPGVLRRYALSIIVTGHNVRVRENYLLQESFTEDLDIVVREQKDVMKILRHASEFTINEFECSNEVRR